MAQSGSIYGPSSVFHTVGTSWWLFLLTDMYSWQWSSSLREITLTEKNHEHEQRNGKPPEPVAALSIMSCHLQHSYCLILSTRSTCMFSSNIFLIRSSLSGGKKTLLYHNNGEQRNYVGKQALLDLSSLN